MIELHGNATRTRCLACGIPYTRDAVHAWIEANGELPACPTCGGIVKPTTVLFGEAMPALEMQEAERRSRAADLFVVLGSSLVVYPAAYMPAHAKHEGATLAIVNLEPTPLDAQADLVLRDKAGEVMAQVVEEVRADHADASTELVALTRQRLAAHERRVVPPGPLVRAAVLIPIVDRGEPHLVFAKDRHGRDPRGQTGFPAARSIGDASLLEGPARVMRKSGSRASVEPLGALDDTETSRRTRDHALDRR